MGKESDVKKLGRVEYIEPNSLFNNAGESKVQNGIPQPYEDYSVSVNLRIIRGNRYGCGMTDDGGDIAQEIFEYSSDNGTLSFIDGTSVNGKQGYLTTNFTDISMNDPNTNTKECLGIESIEIRFDSYYTPTVNIKFVDVRGASLMQPAEFEYYNNGNPNRSNENNQNAGVCESKFFNAFFSFPYPLFRLSVKGFYGKEVTYDLSVLNCNIDFNSRTGNFEINANFIGYMYGMYADLPFSFIYLAPYIQLYGKNTWEEKKNTLDFCYLSTDASSPYVKKDENGNPTTIDGTNYIGEKMYTFPELKRQVDDCTTKAEQENANSDEGKTRAGLEELLNKLNHEVIYNLPTNTNVNKWYSLAENETEENKEGFFFLIADNTPYKRREILGEILKFVNSLNEYNEIAESETYAKYCKNRVISVKQFFQNVYNDAQKIDHTSKQKTDEVLKDIKKLENEKNKEMANASLRYTDEDVSEILSSKIVSLFFRKDETDKGKPTLVFDADSSDFGILGKTLQHSYQYLIDNIIEKFNSASNNTVLPQNSEKKTWNILAFKISNIRYKEDFDETVKDMKDELDKLVKKLDELRDYNVIKALGFDPTIKNIFNMTFAHIDTFMSVFYNTLDRIRASLLSSSDKSRKKETLCGADIHVDVSDNALKSTSENGGKLPPFTLFYKEVTEKDTKDKKFNMIWPGDLNGGEELEEVKLVEAILDATALNKKSFEDVTPSDNVTTRSGKFVPTNYYDIINNGGNPYLDVLSRETCNLSETTDEIVKVFVLRCFFSLLSGSYVNGVTDGTVNGTNSYLENMTKKARLVAELEVGNVVRAFQTIDMEPGEDLLKKLMTLSEDGASFISKYTKEPNPMFIIKTSSVPGVGDCLSYKWVNLGQRGGDSNTCFYPVGSFKKDVLTNSVNGAKLSDYQRFFVQLSPYGTENNGHTCKLYADSTLLDDTFDKYNTSDFNNASKLFPGYGKHKEEYSSAVKNIEMENGLPKLLSYRNTKLGKTNIFMDPLYYVQSTPEARAYLFLLGVPFYDGVNEKSGEFFLPKKVENKACLKLMLLREGAVYWSNAMCELAIDGQSENDPITYTYTIGDKTYNVLDDIEKNHPALGVKCLSQTPKNTSLARKNVLIRYFLKWACGNDNYVFPGATVTAETTNKIEIPSIPLSFQEIEEKFGLCWHEKGSTTKTFLGNIHDGSAPGIALGYESAAAYANFNNLNILYNVDSTGKLGKTDKENIRTDVFLRSYDKNTEKSFSKSDISTLKEFLYRVRRLYNGLDSIIDYGLLDNPSSDFTVPKVVLAEGISSFIKNLKEEYGVSTGQLKNGKNIGSSGIKEKKFNKPENFRSDKLKLACYLALKHIYDRWLSCRRRENWYFSCNPEKMVHKGVVRSDFSRFFYIDDFYHNIGMSLRPNISKVVNWTEKEGGFNSESDEFDLASKSVIKALSEFGYFGNCALLTLPTMLGLARTYADQRNSISDVFKAFPYNDAIKGDALETSFILLNASMPSSVLDNEKDSGGNSYKSDGFDIADTWGEIVPQSMFTDAEETGYVVPCFGVSFAKQNQSFFKDIRLSMSDHQVTEFSIRNEIQIAYQNNRGPRESTIIGQDLFAVFSNYSYTCTVEMMGDAQITPLMYFQLLNIPMWKGAYFITSVEHRIDVEGMTTKFVGTRAARPRLPYTEPETTNMASDDAGQTPQSQEETKELNPQELLNAGTNGKLDEINVDDVDGIVFVVNRKSVEEGEEEGSWVSGVFDVIVQYKNGAKDEFKDYAVTLEARRGLSKKIEDTTPEDNTVLFSLPLGKLVKVELVDAGANSEYRDPGDVFYQFTNKKHMVISDSRLGVKRCEIITGETDYYKYESGGFDRISIGGISPLMLYPNDASDIEAQHYKNERRALYAEVFRLVKRMNEVQKPLGVWVKEGNKPPKVNK